MKLRYLPPGTLRRLRLKWLALGVLLGAGSSAALAMYLAAILPPELAYRSPVATLHPAPAPVQPLPAPVQLPPCLGSGKDCTDPEAAAPHAPGPHPAPAPAPAPHSQRQPLPTHTVPEPGALALVALGLAALAAHRSQS